VGRVLRQRPALLAEVHASFLPLRRAAPLVRTPGPEHGPQTSTSHPAAWLARRRQVRAALALHGGQPADVLPGGEDGPSWYVEPPPPPEAATAAAHPSSCQLPAWAVARPPPPSRAVDTQPLRLCASPLSRAAEEAEAATDVTMFRLVVQPAAAGAADCRLHWTFPPANPGGSNAWVGLFEAEARTV